MLFRFTIQCDIATTLTLLFGKAPEEAVTSYRERPGHQRGDTSGSDVIWIQMQNDRGNCNMDISRRLGILVFMGVPAIIGGGIVYAIFGSLTPMWIYEALLLVTAGAFVSR